MADHHDETARELLRIRPPWISEVTHERDVRHLAAALRKAEADGLRAAAGLVWQRDLPGDVALANRLLALAAEKEAKSG